MVGRALEPLGAVVEKRTKSMLLGILGNYTHPLHHTLAGQSSSRSERLTALCSRTERHRRSFVPSAIRLFNRTFGGR